MKCRTAVAITLGVCALLIATQGAMAQAPVVIRLWDHHVHDKKFRQQIFKEFNRANPDIKVEYTSQVGDAYVTVLDATFRSGDPPDIFIPMGAATLEKMVEMGWVLPLEEVAPSKEELQRWMARFPEAQRPFVENMNVFKGKAYSWPIGAEGGRMMLFWNTKLFREAGLKASGGAPAVPETWDDMRAFTMKITELGQGKVYGIVHGIKNGAWDQDLFWSLAPAAGFPFVGPGFDWRTGLFDFRHPGLKGSIQLWFDMKKDGSIFPGELSMDDEQAKFKFAQDLAGMIFGGHWVPGGLIAINDALEFDTALPPTEKRGERKGGVNIGALAGMSEYVVSSKIQSKAAVWKVIQFMTSAQYQEGWVKAGGGYSVFPEYNKPEYFPHLAIAKIAQMIATGRMTTPWSMLSSDDTKVFGLMETGQPKVQETMMGQWIGQLGWEAWDDLEKRSNKAFDAAIDEARKQGLKVSKADFIFPDWDPAENYPPPKRR